MIWTREQAKALADRALGMSKAEQTSVAINGSERASVRFARNSVTTAGATAGVTLAITSRFGKRSGTVTTARFDDASLQTALRNAEEIAKVSPENPEAMPPLGPQTYTPATAYFDDGDYATVAYFTNEREARRNESIPMPENLTDQFREWEQVMPVERYIDLREPMLVSAAP